MSAKKPPFPRKLVERTMIEDKEGEKIKGKSNKQEVKQRPPTLTLRGNQSPHIIVDALAGTGKTFTIIESAFRVCGINRPDIKGSEEQEAIWGSLKNETGKISPSNIQLIAFNSSIASELKERVPPGVIASTCHAYGKKILAINDVQGAKSKYGVRGQKSLYILADMQGVTLDALFRSMKPAFIFGIQQCVSFLKVNLIKLSGDWETDVMTVKNLVDVHGAVLPDFKPAEKEVLFFQAVFHIYEKSSLRLDVIDFDDMLWLPWILGMEIRQSDLMYVDERQDLNLAQQDLVCRSTKRLILVGDKHQAIYGFAGADVNASDRMEGRLSSGRGKLSFPLTYTRRCGKAIVSEAQKIVSGFKSFPDAHEGCVISHCGMSGDISLFDSPINKSTQEESFLAYVQSGDMVICRTNAPLFKCCLQLIKQGRPFRTTVSKFFQQVISLIKSFEANSLQELSGRLSLWHESQLATCTGVRQDRSILINDMYSAIKAAMDVSTSPSECISLIERVFKLNDEEKVSKVNPDYIFLTSIHQAKGLEAGRVWWLQYDLVPHPKARLKEQEENLRWVATTRAKNVLIKVKSTPKKKGSDNEDE